MKKRFLSILMALSLALSLLPTAAFAEEGDVTVVPEDSAQTPVDPTIDSDDVAAIGDTGYDTLQEAISAASSGDMITLLDNASGGAVTFSKSGTYTLNLGSHTYTCTDNMDVIKVESGNIDLTIQNGSLVGKGTYTYGIYVYALDTNGDKKADTPCDNVTVTLDGVTLDVTDQALGVQGINSNNNLIVKNSTVSAGTAIYFPPITGKLTIENSKITGINNAIVVKGSEVEISGNDTVISATGKPEDIDQPYQGDPEHPETFPTSGSALYVEGGYTSGGGARPISVTIQGGKFTSAHAAAVRDNFLVEEAQVIQVSGGTFSSSVEDYLAPNHECVKPTEEGGMYTVQEMKDKLVIDGSVGEDGNVTGSLAGSFTSGGTTVESPDAGSGIENSEPQVSNDVTVNLQTSEPTQNATTTTLNVTQATAKSLEKANSLTVQTDAGSVKFDKDALTTIAGKNTSVEIKVTENEKDSNLASYTVTATGANDDNLLPVGGNNGTVTITVTKPTGEDIQAWYVNNGVYVEKLTTRDNGGNIEIDIHHLSTVVLTNGTPTSGLAVADVIDEDTGERTSYSNLQSAINAADAGDTVQLLGDVVVNAPASADANAAAINISEAIILDGSKPGGGTFSITAADTGFTMYKPWSSSEMITGKYHMINVTTGGVTLQNLTVNGGWDKDVDTSTESGNAAKSGINVWSAGDDIQLNNVTVKGCSVYGVVVNGTNSVVTADGLNVDGTNQWGVNVDNGGTINMVSGTIDKDFVVEKSESATESGAANITGGTFTGMVKTQGTDVAEDALTITGGTFTGEFTEAKTDSISISGGTYSNDVSDYLEEGLQLSGGDSGTIVPADDTVATVTDANGVTKGYTSLPDAITAANASANAVVTLRENAELTTTQNITQTMKIDLNGHTITGSDIRAFHVKSGTLTLAGQGTVTSVQTSASSALLETSSVIRVGDNNGSSTEAGLVIEAGVTIEAPVTYGVTVFGSGTVETVTIRGTVTATGNAPAVSGNGLYDGTNITIESPANISATCGVAVYQPQDGTLNITGGTITGGVEAKSGTINISGNPTITAVGTPSHVTNDGGPSTAGYAIAVVDNQGYGDGAKVTIEGGTFAGEIEHLSDDADFTGDKGDIDISGGSFDRPVDEKYCADSFVPVTTPNNDGMYTVTEESGSSAAVTYLTLTPRTLSLTVGNTAQLTAVAKDSNDQPVSVTWSSSNPAVAAVNNGVVTANSAGTATITVKAGDLTLTCAVTVSGSSSGGNGGGSSEPSYSPVIDITGNGTIKVSPRTPSEGDEVTITPDPDNGYEVGSVTVTDRSGRTVRVTENRNGTYTFTQPAGRVTIEVTFVRTGENTFFTDVPETFWAYDEIAWAYENGYVNGVTATTFNPNGAISRQQVWMILARLSGYDPADMAAARAWAMENGVSDGTNPGNAVTRQQLVALLFRFAELRNYANDQRADLSVYPDAGTVAEYAVEPMQWSVANDIVGGTTAGTLNPEGTATRAQFAVILYRFWTNV